MHTPDAEGDGIDTFLFQKIYYELDSLFYDARNGKQHCSIEFAVTSLIGGVPSFGFVDERREPGENSLDSLVVSANGAKPKASVMSKLSDIFFSNANNTAVFSKRTLRVVNSQRLSLFDIMEFIHRGRVKFHCDEIVFESSMSPSDASFSFHWASAGIALLGHEAGAMLLPEDADALQVLGSVASDCIDLTKHHLKVHQEVALPLEIRCASAPGGDFFRTLRALAKPPAERRLDASNILIAIAGETDETEDSEMHRREYFCGHSFFSFFCLCAPPVSHLSRVFSEGRSFHGRETRIRVPRLHEQRVHDEFTVYENNRLETHRAFLLCEHFRPRRRRWPGILLHVPF